jgi:hypothetical protein
MVRTACLRVVALHRLPIDVLAIRRDALVDDS